MVPPPVTDQVTAVLAVPVTLALNWAVPPVVTVIEVGATATLT